MSYRGGGGGDRDRSSLAKEGQVYVGNLPPDVRTRDIEDLFDKFGRIGFVNLKSAPNGIPFAFVEFEDPRDAEEAIRDRDGYNYDGYVLRVELPRAMGGGRSRGGRGGRGGFNNSYGGGFNNSYGGGGGRGRGPPPSGLRRSDNRVAISDLPKSASWQDLKDHMREAGDICFADVLPDGTGVIEYVNADDMKYAIKKLDDTKFRSHEGEVSYIRVKEDQNSGSSGRRRRYSRSRSRS